VIAVIIVWSGLVVMIVVMCVWAYRQYLITREFRSEPFLTVAANTDDPPADCPLVSVLVPARDEERNIAECLSSLVAQDYPNKEIIVIDDRSTDGTADVVRELAQLHPEIRLVQIDELPLGWTGKCHALWRGRTEAKGEWLLFVDADTRHSPRNFSVVIDYAVKNKVDMFSMLPHLVCETFWERILQPTVGGILMIRYPLAKVNDPSSPMAFGNGQYILMRASAYDSIGGHEAVRGFFLEDIALGRMVKRNGLTLKVAYAAELTSTRMYTTLREICRGWARIFYEAFNRSLAHLIVGFVMMVIFSIWPYFALGISAGLWLAGVRDVLVSAYFFVALATLILLYVTFVRINRISRVDVLQLVFYPLAGLVSLGVLVASMRLVVGSKDLEWRGTYYDKNGGGHTGRPSPTSS